MPASSQHVVTSVPAADCDISAGVVTTADTMQQRIRQGPAQVQSVLLNLQKRLDEQRLMSALKVCDESTTPYPTQCIES